MGSFITLPQCEHVFCADEGIQPVKVEHAVSEAIRCSVATQCFKVVGCSMGKGTHQSAGKDYDRIADLLELERWQERGSRDASGRDGRAR